MKKVKAQARRFRVLRDSISDESLYEKNPIFRNVRDRVFELGFRFDSDPSQSYFSWPMMHLQKILDTQTIPYRRNRPAFESIRSAKSLGLRQIIKSPPEPNYVLHESSHVIANQVWQAEKKSGALDRSLGKDVVLKSLFCEACANATELLANLYCWTEVDRFDLMMNSYALPPPATLKELVSSVSVLGLPTAAPLTILFFVCTNYNFDRLDRNQARAVFSAAFPARKVSMRELKAVQSIANAAGRLSRNFRLGTTEVYLNTRGIQGSIASITRISFRSLLKNCAKIFPAATAYSEQVMGSISCTR